MEFVFKIHKYSDAITDHTVGSLKMDLLPIIRLQLQRQLKSAILDYCVGKNRSRPLEMLVHLLVSI
jgi:hypothetical protein